LQYLLLLLLLLALLPHHQGHSGWTAAKQAGRCHVRVELSDPDVDHL
jgi:hypothetical protein